MLVVNDILLDYYDILPKKKKKLNKVKVCVKKGMIYQHEDSARKESFTPLFHL